MVTRPLQYLYEYPPEQTRYQSPRGQKLNIHHDYSSLGWQKAVPRHHHHYQPMQSHCCHMYHHNHVEFLLDPYSSSLSVFVGGKYYSACSPYDGLSFLVIIGWPSRLSMTTTTTSLLVHCLSRQSCGISVTISAKGPPLEIHSHTTYDTTSCTPQRAPQGTTAWRIVGIPRRRSHQKALPTWRPSYPHWRMNCGIRYVNRMPTNAIPNPCGPSIRSIGNVRDTSTTCITRTLKLARWCTTTVSRTSW